MTIDDKLKIGEMPKPQYLLEAMDTTGDGNMKWIGIRAYGLDGQVKDFLWWRNFEVGDLNDEAARYHTAAFVARLYVEMKAEVAIGRAIDLHASNQEGNYVAIPNEQGIYGVYVQADKRQMFNFGVIMGGVRSENELRGENPVEFNRIFRQARKVLPYDKK